MSADTMPRNANVAPRLLFPNTKIYDLLACSPLLVWYGICLVQQTPPLIHDIAAMVLSRLQLLPAIDVLSRLAVFSFAAVLIFLLVARQPAAAKTGGIFPRVAAIFGTFLGVGIMLLPHRAINWELKLLSTALILGGMGFALYGLLWLGRSISVMSEARKLVVGGPYTIVRHPLYLGEQITLIGVALQYLSPFVVILLVVQLAFQICRMGFEEEILSETFPEYADYKKRTARLIPGLY
jgi:protein-S-isoprenylcysteine O-methyltransferase Ste14